MSTFTFDRQAFDVVPLGFDDLLCFKMSTLANTMQTLHCIFC